MRYNQINQIPQKEIIIKINLKKLLKNYIQMKGMVVVVQDIKIIIISQIILIIIIYKTIIFLLKIINTQMKIKQMIMLDHYGAIVKLSMITINNQ